MDEINKDQGLSQDRDDSHNPNHLENNHISEDSSKEREITDAVTDQEDTDEVTINELAETNEVADLEEGHPYDHVSDGYIDVSDLDLPEIPPQAVDQSLSDIEPKQGDLPDWLQEMITEPDQPAVKELDLPMPPREEGFQELKDNLSYNWEKEHLELDNLNHHKEVELTQIDEPSVTNLEEGVEQHGANSEEDTAPIFVKENESMAFSEVEGSFDDLKTNKIHQSIEDAEQLLIQGNFQRALPLLKSTLNEVEDFDRITAILSRASKQEGANNHEIWELFGDIALKQNKPADAVDAYAKAIHCLLVNHRGDHEIG